MRGIEIPIISRHDIKQSVIIKVNRDRIGSCTKIQHIRLEKIVGLEYEMRSRIAPGIFIKPYAPGIFSIIVGRIKRGNDQVFNPVIIQVKV